MRMTEKTGLISGVRYIKDHNSVLIISQLGKLIRMDLSQIRDIGRVTQGVRLINLDDPNDRVVGIGLVPTEEARDEESELEGEQESTIQSEDQTSQGESDPPAETEE